MKSSRLLKRAGLLALCLCAGEALADARLEARRHFRNGMALIAQGQYDDGVAELLEAYAIKPHANVLYNIARAYTDAGRVPEALDYYRRYLASNPPDAETVRAAIARLETTQKTAEASAAAEQPRPAVLGPVLPSGAQQPSAVPNYAAVPLPAAPSAQDTQALSALVERLEKAIARAESLPANGAAPTQPQASAEGTAQAPGPDDGTPGATVADDGSVPYEERVVTASRRAQSSLEAPNATTVITSEDIRLSGATNVFDLLRRVPGADVMEMGVSSANVSLRGFNQRIANKVLVLVDGRSEYQDFLGMTLWPNISVGLEEIERIEVIRGPGSALYGANAMLGVINIITQNPGTGPRARFQATVGGGNAASGSFVSHGGTDTLRYRASVGYGQQDKFSRDFADGRPDVASGVADPDLGFRNARGNLAATYALAPNAELGMSAGVNRYFTEIYPLGLLRNFWLDGLGAYGKMDLGVGPVKVKAFWNHLAVDAGPQYEAIGSHSLNTRLTSNVFDGEALFNKGFSLLGEHQLNVGVEARLKRVSWAYLGPLHQELHAAAFVQDEWKLVKSFRLLASYRVDRHPLLDGGKPGLAHSPRVSALYMPWEGHAFRASAASAFREPTFLESYTDLRIPLPGVNGASAITQGNTALRPERLTALELGYRGEAPSLGMDWDVALYQNTVKDLIGLSALERLPAGDSYDPLTGTYLLGRSFFQNEKAVYTARGAELGVNLAPVDGLGIKVSAALQKVTAEGEDSGQCGPCSQAPSYKLYGGLTYRTRADLEFGVDAAYTASTTWIEREPAASDPTIIEPLANALPAYTVINARVGYEAIKNRMTVAVTGSNLGSAHAQHPFGNLIERRVFATVTVTP